MTTCAAILLLTVGVAPANATTDIDETQRFGSDTGVFDQIADTLGITDTVKDALVAKLSAGLPLDSSSGVAPVSESTSVLNGFAQTRRVFADGSVSLESVELSKPVPTGFGHRSVSGCYNYPGVGTFKFERCEVRTDQLAFSMSFEMDGYKGSSGTRYGSIDRAYNLQYAVRGATVSSKSLKVVKAKQSGSGPAKAQATLYWSGAGGLASGTYKLSGYVDYGRVYDTSP